MEQQAVVAQGSNALLYLSIFTILAIVGLSIYLYTYFRNNAKITPQVETEEPTIDAPTETPMEVPESAVETKPMPIDSSPPPNDTTVCEEVVPSQDKLKMMIKNYLESEKGQQDVVILSVHVSTEQDEKNPLMNKVVHVVYQTKASKQESRAFVIELNKMGACEWRVTQMSEVNKGVLKPICLSYSSNPIRHHLFKSLSRCNEPPFTSQGIFSGFNKQLPGTKPYCVTWHAGKPSRTMIYEGATECGNGTDEFKWYHFYAYPDLNSIANRVGNYKGYCIEKLSDPNRIIVHPNKNTCPNQLTHFWVPDSNIVEKDGDVTTVIPITTSVLQQYIADINEAMAKPRPELTDVRRLETILRELNKANPKTQEINSLIVRVNAVLPIIRQRYLIFKQTQLQWIS